MTMEYSSGLYGIIRCLYTAYIRCGYGVLGNGIGILSQMERKELRDKLLESIFPRFSTALRQRWQDGVGAALLF